MANKTRVAIQETHNIPGYHIYGGTIPEQITLRAMTTVEEKMRLSSTGFDTIPKLIKACTVEPEDININALKLFDVQYLMYKLRIITYGPDYKLSLTCPRCGEELEITVNLDDIPVKCVDDNFVEPFKIGPLPISGDIIECRILTTDDYTDIEREAKRIKSKFPNYEGDPEFILTYLKKIVSINGEELPAAKVQKYVENWHAKDMRVFDIKYSKLTDDLGMNTILTEVCSKCGHDFDYGLPITEEFFRPTYND